MDDFVSVRKFKIFNTNNLWINLRAMIDIVKAGKMQMEIIKNPKTMEDGTNIIQLEEAAGAAIKNFKGGAGGLSFYSLLLYDFDESVTR